MKKRISKILSVVSSMGVPAAPIGKRRAVAALMLCAALFATTAYAAGSAGTKDDPLVTYGYLRDSFAKEVASEVNGGFVLVTLQQGQTLKGDIGTEVLLRVGTATCSAASAPGLIDTTTAGTLENGGALAKNHLYMMTIEERGVKATAATVKVLVRGAYTVA